MMNAKGIFLLFLGTLFWGCQKDPDPPKTPEEQLPPATQEGKMTFGCLIDGKAWTPKAGIIPPPISHSYNEITGQFGAFARRNLGNSLFQTVGIGGEFVADGTYTIPPDFVAASDTSTYCSVISFIDPLTGIGSKYFWNTNGVLVITKLDRMAGIISGTFEYDAYSSECRDTIKVTKGRFDIKYK